jgi:hypothetical protein
LDAKRFGRSSGIDHLNNADLVRSVFQEGLANPPTEEAVEEYYSRLYEDLYGSYFPGTYTRVEGYSYVIGSIDTMDAEDWLNYEMIISGGVVTSASIALDDGTTVTGTSNPLSDPTDPASWQTTVTKAPADEQPVLVHPEPQIISGYQIGQAFGSALGQLIGGSNTFARVAAGSALGVVARQRRRDAADLLQRHLGLGLGAAARALARFDRTDGLGSAAVGCKLLV